MAHIREETIARYALDPKLVHDAEAVEQHLRACEECRRALEEVKRFDEALAAVDVWPNAVDDANRERLEELRRLAGAVAEEDAEAEDLLAEFDDAPAATFVWADLPSNADYQTGGVVRALCKRARAMCDRDPRYALELADAAVAIVRKLSDDDYPAIALHEWRGEAWKQRAAALFSLGRFRETLQAVDFAEAEYDKLPHAGVGRVAVDYIRASVLYEQEDYDAAARLLDRSAAAALHLGEIDRYMAAMHMRGSIDFDKGEFRAAAVVSGTILRFGETTKSGMWIARECLTLGKCHMELGDLPLARRYLERALHQFSILRFDAEVVRTELALGRLLFAEARHVEAMQTLRRCVAGFSRLQVLTDAAIAAVWLAEMLHATARDREIPALLNGVVQTFTYAGKLTGALTALAYLKEATLSGRLTERVTSHVCRYLSRVERQPALLFAPPPPDESV
jgi:tetratricopeptide (TPR) repeat protein